MHPKYVIFLLVVLLCGTVLTVDGAAAAAVTAAPDPIYQHQAPDASSGYASQPPQAPQNTYPYGENNYNANMRQDGNYLDQGNQNYYNTPYQNAVIPPAQSAWQLALRVAAKVGLFLIGGVALLVVGGIFTTAVCAATPLCTITFHGISGPGKETVRKVRSLMTPENLADASEFLHKAVSKYGQLQKAVNGQ